MYFSWAQSGGEARSQLPSSTASSSERGQQMVDEEKGKEAVEVVEDAAAGGVVEANTGSIGVVDRATGWCGRGRRFYSRVW